MRVAVILRWLLAFGSMALCISQMAKALKYESFVAAPYLLFSFAALVTAVLLISPETVVRALEFFSRLFTACIYPDAKAAKPPLSYLLARRYGQQLRFQEAAEEYLKIIHYYPAEKDAYVELVALIREIGDEKLARKYTRRFERQFGEEFPIVSALAKSDALP